MKAIFFADEINQFHWTILKSVLMMLSLLPFYQVLWQFWHTSEGSSQIMIGFFALNLTCSSLILCFWSALKLSVASIAALESKAEQRILAYYRQLPMLCLAGVISYLVMSFSS